MARFPAVVVAFEPDAAALLLSRRAKKARTMRVVHLHEIPDVTLYGKSVISRVSIRFMLRELKKADLVVVADEDRARYTAEKAHLQRVPTVVMNCPPVLNDIPRSKLLPWLHERGLGDRRIVHFQGAIGEERGLKAVIASMRYWPVDAIFVIVGEGSPALKEELLHLAAKENVSERVLFVGRVPYADVLAFAVGAGVGITLMEPINSNWEFAAGASNKRFEYASLGIPQVTNTGPGMQRLFEATGIAVLVDARDPEMIGRAIDQLFGDRAFAMSLGKRARALHLSRYNYEAQFAPVLERVADWLSSRSVR
jgi:glycosyltransferase involved in cell wall biosynthesis